MKGLKKKKESSPETYVLKKVYKEEGLTTKQRPKKRTERENNKEVKKESKIERKEIGKLRKEEENERKEEVRIT
jgi:hypothetical protein